MKIQLKGLRFCDNIIVYLSLQLALDMWRKLMIEPLQAVLIRMLLNEIKKYVSHTSTRMFFFFKELFENAYT